MYAGWPFFASALDNAQLSLGTADPPTARRYASLASAEARAACSSASWRSTSARVSSVLQVTRQQELLERSPVLARSIKLRNPYVDALHVAQLALLRRFRALPEDAPARRAAGCWTRSTTASTASPRGCRRRAKSSGARPPVSRGPGARTQRLCCSGGAGTAGTSRRGSSSGLNSATTCLASRALSASRSIDRLASALAGLMTARVVVGDAVVGAVAGALGAAGVGVHRRQDVARYRPCPSSRHRGPCRGRSSAPTIRLGVRRGTGAPGSGRATAAGSRAAW